MYKLTILISTALLSTAVLLHAQNIDSLYQGLENSRSADEQFPYLIELAYTLRVSDIDKAVQLTKKAEMMMHKLSIDNALPKLLLVKGTLAMDSGNYLQAIATFKSGIAVIRNTDNKSLFEDLYNNLGISFKRIGQLDSSNTYYRKSLGYVEDVFGKGRIYINLGSNFIASGQLDSAAAYQLNAIKIFEKLKNPNALTIAYLNLGNIHYKKEDYDLSMTCYRQSLMHAIEAKHKPVESRNYLNIGSIFSMNNEPDSAEHYFKKAIVLQKEVNDQTGIAASCRSLGELEVKRTNYLLAKEYFIKSTEIYVKANHLEGMIRGYRSIGWVYQMLGDLPSAKDYIDRAIELSQSKNEPHELQKVLEVARDIYSSIGYYKEAYSFLSEEKQLSDSIFSEQKIKQIAELEAKYQTEKKDNEIAALSQQSQIQALMINQRNTQLLGAGVLLLVLILVGIVVSQRRSYKYKQTVAEIEQRFLRVQMNPHFIFNALASIQNYIIQNNTKESISYLARFGKLMRQILEHSREEFIPIHEEADMLTNYLEIQKLRFKNRFDFEILIDEDIDVESTKIPPLFAQPFVENAIEHGLKNKIEGMVTVRFSRIGKKNIILEVKDNGDGILHDADQKPHKSLATEITRQRLRLLSKRLRGKYSLQVESREMQGTTAQLVLPMQV